MSRYITDAQLKLLAERVAGQSRNIDEEVEAFNLPPFKWWTAEDVATFEEYVRSVLPPNSNGNKT